MLNNMVHIVTRFGQNKLRAVITSAMLAGVPTAALARHHDFRPDFFPPLPPVVVPLAVIPCDPPAARVWVEPVYQTITQRVWVPAVTRTEIQRVNVPAQYGWRDVVVHGLFGIPHIRHEQVLISPAHCEDQSVEVVVTPGYYADQPQQVLVCSGHWQDVP